MGRVKSNDNAFLEPAIGTCVAGIPSNVAYTCTLSKLNNGESFDLIVDVNISNDSSDSDTLKEVKYMVISDEFEETLNSVVNLITMAMVEDTILLASQPS